MRIRLSFPGLLCAAMFTCSAIFACVGMFACVARAQTVDDALQSPEMTFIVQPSSLEISGAVSSIAHEEILRETAARMFAARTVQFDLKLVTILPPGWSLASDLTLQALAETRSATAIINASGVFISGFTENSARWLESAERIKSNLPDEWNFTQQVEGISPASSINRQCIELFRTAIRGRKIEFDRASATLGTATAPLLDELIQIAADCPDASIDITGHTDSTGDETVNVALSQARANSVAAYIRAGGIPARRISATGAGSSQPLTEEISAQSRQLNRRIEIDLRFP